MNAKYVLTAATLLGLTTAAWAQQKGANYFPADLGRTWTYKLILEANGKSKTIEYTTRVERREDLGAAGTCEVFVSRSGERMLKEVWYSLADGKVVQHRERGYRTTGRAQPQQVFTGRTLIEFAELEAFSGKKASEPGRKWTCSDGSNGVLVLSSWERLYLPGKVGDLKQCLVMVDKGSYYKGKGEDKKLVRRSELTVWYAPGLGLVKEELKLFKPDGTLIFRTVATLTKHQEP